MFNFLLIGRSVELDLLDVVSAQQAMSRKTPALFQPLLQTRSSRLKTRLLVGIVITRPNKDGELGVLLHLGKELVLMNNTNQIRK